ncbi:hypothetical protein HMPREF0091_11214 [Fannyhessea vaginae DSM 15829]|uniref:Uncharacterized protein n=1 Tax=Fannyhessea vaginae DSM 15829 TaxID=525256 RepID=F1T6X8_9ACTN|nr:hypothetical protein HMPREF0091_11214 [Fannyhessea vaginae DSM 15829]
MHAALRRSLFMNTTRRFLSSCMCWYSIPTPTQDAHISGTWRSSISCVLCAVARLRGRFARLASFSARDKTRWAHRSG